MKALFRLASIFTLVLLVDLGCRKETKAKDVASNAQQDTMLMRDLAEANKNTAAASSLDNSLNTVRTGTDGLSPLVEEAQNRPADRAVTRPLPPGNQALTSGPRITAPTTA
ncbi:MAG TPA: hypothetical protein VK648_11050, partial [Gemmatimonadaceae bacterium]|nr:hypothetical protein [Gemmatimonadaceae bacterium]